MANRKIRYAVVGLGHIAQVAVLPAFKRAKNSKLAAIVSGDAEKRMELAEKYRVKRALDYSEYDQLLAGGEIDAVFIALPNDMHRDYTVRAARAGVHVLCEKPLAVTAEDCRAMISAAEQNNVKLMTAYRLHFEEGNLSAIEKAQRGELGELRLFNSDFCMQLASEDNIRVNPREKGGGTLYDIGVYCINAARYLFRDEPTEVSAFTEASADPRFDDAEEATSVIMRFPGARMATFNCSFGAADISTYTLIGADASLKLDPAYTYHGKIVHHFTKDGKTTKTNFKQRDQFAAELTYFSDCILNDRMPEPSGEEGLADVRIIEALYRSAETGQAVKLAPFERSQRPGLHQEIHHSAAWSAPEPVNAEAPSED